MRQRGEPRRERRSGAPEGPCSPSPARTLENSAGRIKSGARHAETDSACVKGGLNAQVRAGQKEESGPVGFGSALWLPSGSRGLRGDEKNQLSVLPPHPRIGRDTVASRRIFRRPDATHGRLTKSTRVRRGSDHGVNFGEQSREEDGLRADRLREMSSIPTRSAARTGIVGLPNVVPTELHGAIPAGEAALVVARPANARVDDREGLIRQREPRPSGWGASSAMRPPSLANESFPAGEQEVNFVPSARALTLLSAA